MKKFIYLFLTTIVFVAGSCKKEKMDPISSDQDAYNMLQGKWIATQQSSTTNGQPDSNTQYFNKDEAVFEFNGNELRSYNGKDQSSTLRIYSWKVVNGELLLREQYADSANVYKLSFEGSNTFSLTETYPSGGKQIAIVIRFSKS